MLLLAAFLAVCLAVELAVQKIVPEPSSGHGQN